MIEHILGVERTQTKLTDYLKASRIDDFEFQLFRSLNICIILWSQFEDTHILNSSEAAEMITSEITRATETTKIENFDPEAFARNISTSTMM